jgi:hypothetical protein
MAASVGIVGRSAAVFLYFPEVSFFLHQNYNPFIFIAECLCICGFTYSRRTEFPVKNLF